MKNLTNFYKKHKIEIWLVGGLFGLFVAFKIVYWLMTSIGLWILVGGVLLILYIMVKYFKVPIKDILK